MISRNEAKYIQSLYHKKNRDEEGVFVAEGPKLLEEFLNSDFVIRKLYAVKEWQHQKKLNVPVTEVTEAELQRISHFETANKVLAVIEKRKPGTLKLDNKISIALDGIQDPGNVGTIIRIADWFGIDTIIATKDTADVYNPKVVQSTMGSLIRVNVFYKDLKNILQNTSIPVYGALLKGINVYEAEPIQEGILVIGNESKGIRNELLPFIKKAITIPQKGKAESLNAAVATGIILSHLDKG